MPRAISLRHVHPEQGCTTIQGHMIMSLYFSCTQTTFINSLLFFTKTFKHHVVNALDIIQLLREMLLSKL